MSEKNSKTNESEILAFAKAHGLNSIDDLISFPKYVQVETVSLCNATCEMCPTKEVQRDGKAFLMQQDVFDKIVNDVSSHSAWIERFTIQGEGEPLIDKGLEKRIKALKEIGVKFVVFGTNASLFTKERAESIIASGVDEVSFSIDGATAETFESIRTPLKFDQCVANVETFITIRDKMNPNLNIRIRMTLQEKNIQEFDAFKSFWEKKLRPNDRVYGRLLHSWGNWLKGYNLPPEQDPAILNAKPCTAPFSTLFVLSDGRVALCCQDFNGTVILGHVKEESIQEVWHNQPISKIREMHLSAGRNSMDMCHNCNLWDPTTSKDFSEI